MAFVVGKRLKDSNANAREDRSVQRTVVIFSRRWQHQRQRLAEVGRGWQRLAAAGRGATGSAGVEEVAAFLQGACVFGRDGSRRAENSPHSVDQWKPTIARARKKAERGRIASSRFFYDPSCQRNRRSLSVERSSFLAASSFTICYDDRKRESDRKSEEARGISLRRTSRGKARANERAKERENAKGKGSSGGGGTSLGQLIR